MKGINPGTMEFVDSEEGQYHVNLSLAKRSYEWYVWFVHKGLFRHAKHTKMLCARLQAMMSQRDQRLIIMMPPRHGKSMTVTETYPSYFLMHNPESRVIISCYGDDFAQDFGRSNRSKMQEFGNIMHGLTIAKDKGTAKAWDISGHRGGLQSSGLGGVITGKGADLLIIDDPIKNMMEADSKTYRDRVYKEWRGTLRSRVQSGGNAIVILTHWHEDDLAGRLLSEDGNTWEVLSLPAVCDDENDLLGRQIGDPLWPQGGYNADWAERTRREVGSRVWSALYQQQPSPGEGGLFKREWWQRWSELPSSLIDYMQSWDCAFKDTGTSDYVVGQVWARSESNPARRYLLDQVRGRMTFTETINAIRDLSAKWPRTERKLIEDKANGSAVIDMLKNEIPGIIPVEPKGGKVVRANAVTANVEAGNVFIPLVSSWIGDFVEELSAFPSGKHDDQVDAMSQANAWYNDHNSTWDFIY